PRQGSVGASGDLAPLAHMALPLIGEGLVHFQDRIMPALVAIKEAGLNPLELEAKEGLAMINGTQVSAALGIKALLAADNILKTADISGAMSVEASLSSRSVFEAKIHKLKKHRGQIESAGNVWRLLEKSAIVDDHADCDRIQDPYSFRCIPHVHGASRELYKSAKDIVENEANSISDNPLIFSNKEIRSSGHFHAEAVAQALDILSISISEIGAISERRINYFMKGQHLNSAGAFILAIDMPSGLYPNAPIEDPDAVVKANHTLSFQTPKLSFFMPSTGIYTNTWEAMDIGLDPEFLMTQPPIATLLHKQHILSWYQPRAKILLQGYFWSQYVGRWQQRKGRGSSASYASGLKGW
ncbi:aromatic amino acid lyase, partial [Gilvibacter sp.]|uniref:aromatic amino acid lyase n=1 Tax=Gilvibacter sp. TaxID=2729997 RepID=UPI0035BE94F4